MLGRPLVGQVLRATALATAVVLLGSLGLAGAAPAHPPESAHASPPIRFAKVASPVRPDRPGKGPSTTSVVYPPATIQSAYNYGTFANGGAGTTIAIVDAYGDPSLAQDLAAFDAKFGLPAATVNVISTDGGPTSTNTNWALETALDVEWAHASAPAATINLIVTPDASLDHLLNGVTAAAQPGVAALSMSWGAPEATFATYGYLTSYESAFTAARNNGIILLASSGDQGAYNGTHPRTLSVGYPASSPEVVGVGGTTLSVTSAGAYAGETAWSSSGGGYSVEFGEPSYQSGAKISEPGRGVPDVAFDADPNTGVYVYSGGTWYAVGGTSVGSPNWAAVVADGRAYNGTSLDLGNLYGAYDTNARTDLHDVTSGSNGYYSATSGWDAVTGIGSPNVANLITNP